jgi:hypothetical protein
MFRTAEFKISRPMYAVRLDTFSVGGPQAPFPNWGVVAAVWFRRRSRVTAACGGFLKDSTAEAGAPVDARDFLSRYTDGRYGGDCVARWDGSTLWSLESERSRAEYLAVLRPMLEAYPAIPPGFDGWWHFG